MGSKEAGEAHEMLPQNVLRGYGQSSMFLTESDTGDEEQLLFESKNYQDSKGKKYFHSSSSGFGGGSTPS